MTLSHYGLSADDCLGKLKTWQTQRPAERCTFTVSRRQTHWWLEAEFVKG